ncbi:hypothetical protein [Tenacibaculum piscium]|uniref:hypothetical protein n=1 Tax=Tenacibaculum piscium TaxID=1458515 RepID=UPI001F2C295B|nr:hypothetical protein [Tenacibaculum piscium]
MKYKILIFLFVFLLVSCNSKSSKPKNIDSGFEKSFKEQNENTFNEHIDSITNIYSNFKYNVAYDGPDKWNFDTGVSEHTIYRTYESDSAITFSVNVIEVKKNSIKKNKNLNIWTLYQENKEQMDKPLTKLLEEQLNTKVEGFKATKAYLKNNVALRRTLNYMIRNLDYEYDNTVVQYQVLIDNLTFTFSLDIPTMFYKENPYYYEELFNNVYFLKNGERLNQLMNNQNK